MFNKNISLMYSVIVIVFLGIFMLVHIKKNFSSCIGLEYKKSPKKMITLSVILGIFIGVASNIFLDLISEDLKSEGGIGIPCLVCGFDIAAVGGDSRNAQKAAGLIEISRHLL